MGKTKVILKKSNYSPSQWAFINTTKPITGFVGGFGSGKTHALLSVAVICHIKRKDKTTGKSYGYALYPTQSLGLELFMRPLKDKLESLGIKITKFSEKEGKIQTCYGSIVLVTTNQWQRIVGSTATWAVSDELDLAESQQASTGAFYKILGRLRAPMEEGQEPQLYIACTPEGYGTVYNIFIKKTESYDPAQDKRKLLIKASTYDNEHNLSPSYIENLRSQYPASLLEAYLHGNFVNLAGQAVFSEFKRENHVKTRKEIMSGIDTTLLYVSCDFNTGNQPCVFHIIHSIGAYSAKHAISGQTQPNEQRIKVIGSVVIDKNASTYNMATKLCERLNQLGCKYITINGDAAGSRTNSSQSVTNDYSILEQELARYGYTVGNGTLTFDVPRANPSIKSSINDTNRALMRHGMVEISDTCTLLIDDLEQLVWDEKIPDKVKCPSAERGHAVDALRYHISTNYPIEVHYRAASTSFGRG